MFKTYDHAELGPAAILGGPGTRHWQFVELEIHHPWFYVEWVRGQGADVVGSMLMIPTVPILQQILSELGDHSWIAQAHLMSPGHLRGGGSWLMEPLLEVGVAEGSAGLIEGYIYKVEGGTSYSSRSAGGPHDLKVTELIFSAERDLRVVG